MLAGSRRLPSGSHLGRPLPFEERAGQREARARGLAGQGQAGSTETPMRSAQRVEGRPCEKGRWEATPRAWAVRGPDTQRWVGPKGIRAPWAGFSAGEVGQCLRVAPHAGVGRGPPRSQFWPRSPWALLPVESPIGPVGQGQDAPPWPRQGRNEVPGPRGLCRSWPGVQGLACRGGVVGAQCGHQGWAGRSA